MNMKITDSLLNYPLLHKLLVGVLALLGFSSCHSDEEEDDYPCMYGMPVTTFEVKGTVTDAQNNPVYKAAIVPKNANISDSDYGKPTGAIAEDWCGDYYQEADTILTDQQGQYAFIIHDYWRNKNIRIVCLPPNDSDLAADSTEVTVEYPNSDGAWVSWGDATVDFSLKSK